MVCTALMIWLLDLHMAGIFRGPRLIPSKIIWCCFMMLLENLEALSDHVVSEAYEMPS